jgi:hypothetical protein
MILVYLPKALGQDEPSCQHVKVNMKICHVHQEVGLGFLHNDW